MESSNRVSRVRLSASAYGIAALALSLALFSVGVFRGELSATVTGASLLVYFAFSLVTLIVSVFLRRDLIPSVSRGNDGAFRVSGPVPPQPAATAGANARAFFRKALSKTSIIVSYATDPFSPTSKAAKITLPYRDAGCRHDPGPLPRGNYEAIAVRILVSDFADFLSLSWRIDSFVSVEPLVVRPVPVKCRIPELPPGATGTTTGKSTRSRSEELHETRPYLPGDDPRKVNWKVYAHSGELSVREGELLPPPTSEYVLAFSEAFPPASGKTERRRSQEAFDVLLSRASFLALRLLEDRHVVTVMTTSADGTPSKKSFARDDVNAENALLEALSAPRLKEMRGGMENAIDSCPSRAEILLFSLPSNAPSGLSRYSGRMRVFIGPTGPVRHGTSLSSFLRRLVFIADDVSGPGSSHTYESRIVENACTNLFREGLCAEAL